MAAVAAAGSAAAPQNLLHVQFKNPEFLAYLSHLQTQGVASQSQGHGQQDGAVPPVKFDPNHPLNEHNVMAYFATSPFFDRRSNNEQIRMQNIANGSQNLLGGGMGAKQEEEELKRFTGLEFVLVHAKTPACFVVHKRWRTSPTETTTLSAYYIVNDSIYQAPDLYSVLATRLQSTVHGLKTSLSAQRAARPAFNPRRGHHGRFIVPDLDQEDEAGEDDDDDEEELHQEEDQEEDAPSKAEVTRTEPVPKRAKVE